MLFSLLSLTSINASYEMPPWYMHTPHTHSHSHTLLTLVVEVNWLIKWLWMLSSPLNVSEFQIQVSWKSICSVEYNLSRTLGANTLDWIIKSYSHELETVFSSKLVIISRIQETKSFRSSREKNGYHGRLSKSFHPM